MRSRRRLYKLDLGLARRMVAATIGLCLLVAAGSACRTAPKAQPPSDVESMSPAEVLHQAAVSVFRERELGVSLESARFLVVNSEYHDVTDDLRRRFVARVIRGPEGAMGLKVIAEYQRRLELDDGTHWEPIDTDELRERARGKELELGRAIERRFERWSER